jgi:hypothetical protein
MKKQCNHVQEKIACSITLDLQEQKHIADCTDCQNVFADYQTLALLLDEDMNKVEVPDYFSDKVMASIEQMQNESDWFERFGLAVSRMLEIPLVQYGSLATGFGVGALTFVRFVAFIFIPA